MSAEVPPVVQQASAASGPHDNDSTTAASAPSTQDASTTNSQIASSGASSRYSSKRNSKSFLGLISLRFTERFMVGDKLGEGGFATVHACEDKTGKIGGQVACKTINKRPLYAACNALDEIMAVKEGIDREVDVMERLKGHPNIVQVVKVYKNSERVRVVMELCNGGDLRKYLKKRGRGLGESEAAAIFKQVTEAIKFCHDSNIVHRDIKLDNVLLSFPEDKLKKDEEERAGEKTENGSHGEQNEKQDREQDGEQDPKGPGSGRSEVDGDDGFPIAKLADFGLAKIVDDGQKVSGYAGTRVYMAPEVLAGDWYDYKADIWSLGVLLYALLSAELPFDGTLKDINSRDGRPDFSRHVWKDVSRLAKELIEQMIVKNPEARISCEEVLKHPWFQYAKNVPRKKVVLKFKMGKKMALKLRLAFWGMWKTAS